MSLASCQYCTSLADLTDI